MSRNSPLESASAPSAERLIRPRSRQTRVLGGSIQKTLKKLPHRRYHLSHPRGGDAVWTTCWPTFGLLAASLTTRPMSTMHPTTVANCAQLIHEPTHLPRWADIGLSPISTGPNTVARISPRFLLRRRRLGTHRSVWRGAPLRRSMSPPSISFQVEPESSTVVHREPLRSLVRIGATRGETPRNRWLDLIVVWIEGTLWTWRRQRLVSPI